MRDKREDIIYQKSDGSLRNWHEPDVAGLTVDEARDVHRHEIVRSVRKTQQVFGLGVFAVGYTITNALNPPNENIIADLIVNAAPTGVPQLMLYYTAKRAASVAVSVYTTKTSGPSSPPSL